MVSLNDINHEADEKYGPFIVDDVPGGDVKLRNALRLAPNEREQMRKLDAAFKAAVHDKDGIKILECGSDLLKLVAVGDDGNRLLGAIEHDPVKVVHILTLYREATQPGEALPSES